MAKTAIMKVWDVELGLAIHVEAPNGKYIVIDMGSKRGVSPLQSLRNKTVGYMVITHPHHDHFSDILSVNCGYPKVLWRVKDYSRDDLIASARDIEKVDFEKYCDFSDSFTERLQSINDPRNDSTFDGLTAEIFCTSECNKENKNNFSAIVVLKLGNAKVVVCGDNEKESLEVLMKNGTFKESIANAYVLVAPHHGRESGYFEEFVGLVNPYLTIISDTSKGDTSVTEKYDANTKGYPVLNRSTLKKEDRKCLTTRKDGNIQVTFGESDNPNGGTLSAITHCSF